MPGVLSILGSARGEGDTAALLDAVLAGRFATRLDLLDLDLRPYDYGRAVDGDDFLTVAEAIVAHQVIVFATPVYWYAMSGRMKVLFDRFTDLVTVRKDLGRRLKGRIAFLVACGSDPQLPEGFEVPFHQTAEYLHMVYGGSFYGQTTKNIGFVPTVLSAARAFGDRIVDAASESESH